MLVSLLQYKDKKCIEDIVFDYLFQIPANKTHCLGYIVSFNIFLNKVKCLITDNISEQEKANYSEVFDFDSDYYKTHSNVMKMENASATDDEEGRIITETENENKEVDLIE